MRDVVHLLGVLQKEMLDHANRNALKKIPKIKANSKKTKEEMNFYNKGVESRREARETYKNFLKSVSGACEEIAKELLKTGVHPSAKTLWGGLRERGLTIKSDGISYDYQTFSMYYYKMIKPTVDHIVFKHQRGGRKPTRT